MADSAKPSIWSRMFKSKAEASEPETKEVESKPIVLDPEKVKAFRDAFKKKEDY